MSKKSFVLEDTNPWSTSYKPYTLREFKEKKEKDRVGSKMGGLGANIGNEEWEKAQAKKERIKNFSKLIDLNWKPIKVAEPKSIPKEISTWEKAIEYARS
jgi:hypothetical protein